VEVIDDFNGIERRLKRLEKCFHEGVLVLDVETTKSNLWCRELIDSIVFATGKEKIADTRRLVFE